MTKTSLWLGIAENLRHDIANQHYAPGDKLPTEAAFAKRFGVNRHTVRRALKALTEEGLIITRRGAGAFVAMTPTEYPIGRRVRFHQNLTAARRSPTKQVLSLDTRGADAQERMALKLPEQAMVMSIAACHWPMDNRSHFSPASFPPHAFLICPKTLRR